MSKQSLTILLLVLVTLNYALAKPQLPNKLKISQFDDDLDPFNFDDDDVDETTPVPEPTPTPTPTRPGKPDRKPDSRPDA